MYNSRRSQDSNETEQKWTREDAVVPVREEWDTEMHNWRPLQLYFVYDPYVEEDTPQELYNLSQKIIAVLCRRTPNWSPETPFLARVSGTAKLSKSEEFTYLSVHREGGVVYATPGQAEDYLAVNSEASLADLVIFVIRFDYHSRISIDPKDDSSLYIPPYTMICSKFKFGFFVGTYGGNQVVFSSVPWELMIVEIDPRDYTLEHAFRYEVHGVVRATGLEAYRRILMGLDKYQCYNTRSVCCDAVQEGMYPEGVYPGGEHPDGVRDETKI
ncbi:uncharacterized protein LOC135371150 isoform X2 [Ornithodoros turicata]|uniref:uncharacterized protein LOC135371150 isoform X2 n=1 Tax=Ornithodoros turicata TaxID=34597 RepID=UPI003139DED4